MSIFSKIRNAKAKAKQVKGEGKAKETNQANEPVKVKVPYKHVVTHAAKDCASMPGAFDEADKPIIMYHNLRQIEKMKAARLASLLPKTPVPSTPECTEPASDSENTEDTLETSEGAAESSDVTAASSEGTPVGAESSHGSSVASSSKSGSSSDLQMDLPANARGNVYMSTWSNRQTMDLEPPSRPIHTTRPALSSYKGNSYRRRDYSRRGIAGLSQDSLPGPSPLSTSTVNSTDVSTAVSFQQSSLSKASSSSSLDMPAQPALALPSHKGKEPTIVSAAA